MTKSTTAHPLLADAAGLTVTSQHWASDRLVEVRVGSEEIGREVGVRILVPDGYDPSSRQRAPTLYLLHGGLGSFRDWTDSGAIESVTAASPRIVVMPSGGTGGWYRDWHNFGRGGAPRWETFHLDRLVPWIDSQFTTRPDRNSRAIGGVSMGGFGALSYAARRPDSFGTAASFSGALDTSFPLVAALICVSPAAHRRLPFSINRFPVLGRADWHAHNPRRLAERLRGTHLTLTTGNGRPSRFARGRDPRPKDLQEHQVRAMTLSMARRLDALGIEHTLIDYGDIGHTWDNWTPALRAWLAVIDAPQATE